MLYITTPCSRPNNLEKISKSIPRECFWAVIAEDGIDIPNIKNLNLFRCKKTGFVGANGRNHFLEQDILKDGDWLYSLDDDNIIHPDMYQNISKYLENEEYSIIHWGQILSNEKQRLTPQILINGIDAACFTTSWIHNKHIKYNTEKYEYDGIYALECAKNGTILTIHENLCYYNYLK